MSSDSDGIKAAKRLLEEGKEIKEAWEALAAEGYFTFTEGSKLYVSPKPSPIYAFAVQNRALGIKDIRCFPFVEWPT